MLPELSSQKTGGKASSRIDQRPARYHSEAKASPIMAAPKTGKGSRVKGARARATGGL
jgi:hypothetical protein